MISYAMVLTAHHKLESEAAICHSAQEIETLQNIAQYFDHQIAEVPWNDEERFLEVLQEAGLSSGT